MKREFRQENHPLTLGLTSRSYRCHTSSTCSTVYGCHHPSVGRSQPIWAKSHHHLLPSPLNVLYPRHQRLVVSQATLRLPNTIRLLRFSTPSASPPTPAEPPSTSTSVCTSQGDSYNMCLPLRANTAQSQIPSLSSSAKSILYN